MGRVVHTFIVIFYFSFLKFKLVSPTAAKSQSVIVITGVLLSEAYLGDQLFVVCALITTYLANQIKLIKLVRQTG